MTKRGENPEASTKRIIKCISLNFGINKNFGTKHYIFSSCCLAFIFWGSDRIFSFLAIASAFASKKLFAQKHKTR